MKKKIDQYRVATELQGNMINDLESANFIEIRFSDSIDILNKKPHIIATYGLEPQLSQYKKAIIKVYKKNCI